MSYPWRNPIAEPAQSVRVALVARLPDRHAALMLALRRYGMVVPEVLAPERLSDAMVRVPDLLLVDHQEAGGAAWATLRAIVALPDAPPVILVSERSHSIDRIIGLELGAEDFIDGRCSYRELVARIRSVLRRRRGLRAPKAAPASPATDTPVPAAVVQARDPDGAIGSSLDRAGASGLSSTERRLLSIFLRRPGEVISRQTLVEALYGAAPAVSLRNVDVCVSRLRRKLAAGDEEVIRTVRGRGYLLLPDFRPCP